MSFWRDLFAGGMPAIPAQHRQEVDQLIEELTEIGRRDDFLSERPGGGFNSECRHIRTRAIGKRLNEIGGLDLMQAVQRRIRKKLGASLASHLEYAWDAIGGWIP